MALTALVLILASVSRISYGDSSNDDLDKAEDSTSILQMEVRSKRSSMRVSSNDDLKQVKNGAKLSEMFKMAGAELPLDSVTRDLLQSFRVCGACNEFKRLGEVNDGGYLVCMDNLRGGHIKAGYSIGLDDHDRFSNDLLHELHIPVNQFDCTVKASPFGCGFCTFFKKCIRGDNGERDTFPGQSWSLSEIISETGMAKAPDRSLFLKMDVEAEEWSVLNGEFASSNNLRKFQQIVIEFHNLAHVANSTDVAERYLSGLRKLFSAGFQVVHIHGNNYAGSVELGGFRIPDAIEVTFDYGHAAQTKCNAKQEYLDGDAPNDWKAVELPMAMLPVDDGKRRRLVKQFRPLIGFG